MAQTGTATVADEKREPVGANKQHALRAGRIHMTPTGLVTLFVTSDEVKNDKDRLRGFVDAMQHSDNAHIKEALRGQSKEERQEKKQAPFIEAALRKGMTLSTAKARLSEMSAIWRATQAGDYDASKLGAWHKAVAAARERLNASRQYKKRMTQQKFLNTAMQELRGDYPPEMTKTQKIELLDKAEAKAKELAQDDAIDKHASRITGAAERIFTRHYDQMIAAGADDKAAKAAAAIHCEELAKALVVVAAKGVTVKATGKEKTTVVVKAGMADNPRGTRAREQAVAANKDMAEAE